MVAKSDQEKRKTKGRFLVAVCAFIFNGDKILVCKRSEDRDHIHPLLKRDIEHLLNVKNVYFNNKELFIREFKKSN